MFVSSLGSPESWQIFLNHPIWQRSIEWIRSEAEKSAVGKHELGEPGWFAAVDEYVTKPAADCQWENHTRTVDLQYLISGVEGIAVLPVVLLGEPVLYKEASDTQKFAATTAASNHVVLLPGDFVILMPGDAHCPKIAVGEPAALRKVVVKIPVEMLGRTATT